MAGGAAVEALQAGLHEDVSLEIVIPAARAILRRRRRPRSRGSSGASSSRRCRGSRRARPTRRSASGGSPGRSGASSWSWPARWTRRRPPAPRAGEAAGATPGPRHCGRPSLDDAERRLLQLLTEGRTNAEIAAELDLGEDDVAQRLARLQARLGTSSRAEATSLAFRGLAAVGSR